MNTCFAHIPDLPLPFNHSIENICEMQTCFNGFKLKAGWVNAELLSSGFVPIFQLPLAEEISS